MKWSFDIFPRDNFMMRFLYNDSTDFVINERMGEMPYCFFIASKHFEPHKDSSKVYEIASFMVRILNGYSLLIHDSKKDHGAIYLGDMLNEETNEKLLRSSYKTEVNFGEIDNLLSDIDNSGKSAEARIMSLALGDSFVRNLMLIIGDEMSFNAMYMALDEIKHFLHDKEPVNNLVSSRKLSRFGQTANNFQTLGVQARHGTKNQKPPVNPMSLEEAQSFISELIFIVLDKYYGIRPNTIADQEFDDALFLEEE